MASGKLARRLAVALSACALTCFAVVWSTGCAPQSENREGGQPREIEASSWSIESDCLQCHSVEADSLADDSCLASTHRNEGLGCIDCHTDESSLSAAHEKATTGNPAPKKLKKTEVDESTCTACHGTYEELATATLDKLVIDSKGTAVNPHEAPNLTDGHEGNITCASCHAMHEEANTAEEAHETCLNCHHEDVFECGTCHS